jgi:sialate O-acetylesterase
MVLQQKEKVAVWGKAKPGVVVVITPSWSGKKYRVLTNAAGDWKASIKTAKAGGPYSVSFFDGDTVQLNDVLLGEVWLCSGQSNMEMPLEGWGKIRNYKEEVASAVYPQIRLLKVEQATSGQPLPEAKINDGWQSCSPQSVANFSAVAYFFARDIQLHHNIPIGLIQSAYSGTPAEAWTSGSSLKKLPEFDSLVHVISSKPGPVQSPHTPTVLFNAMIAPLAGYVLRGVIWYQGEANAARAEQYKLLFPLLVRDWRTHFNNNALPFYFVQLANYKERKPLPEEASWAELREAQLQTLSLHHTGMAVAIDLGDEKDIHPKNKQDVGKRLALIARAKIYREKIAYSGPVYKSHKVKGDKVIISFQHANGGLVISGDHELKGFALAGKDGKFYWAQARIDGSRVIVWSDHVTEPMSVRYAWAFNPICNLYNGAGLPASPFRTDHWKTMPKP